MDILSIVLTILSTLGANSLILFFVKRYFDKRDKEVKKEQLDRTSLMEKVDASLETVRLLSYHRMSEELETILNKGFATPAERRLIDEMYANYKAHGWNGDMDARLERVYKLRTDRPPRGEHSGDK